MYVFVIFTRAPRVHIVHRGSASSPYGDSRFFHNTDLQIYALRFSRIRIAAGDCASGSCYRRKLLYPGYAAVSRDS